MTHSTSPTEHFCIGPFNNAPVYIPTAIMHAMLRLELNHFYHPLHAKKEKEHPFLEAAESWGDQKGFPSSFNYPRGKKRAYAGVDWMLWYKVTS